MQKVQLTSSINIELEKVASDSLTTGMLSKNFKQTVQKLSAKNNNFMKIIKGTLAYWKKFSMKC